MPSLYSPLYTGGTMHTTVNSPLHCASQNCKVKIIQSLSTTTSNQIDDETENCMVTTGYTRFCVQGALTHSLKITAMQSSTTTGFPSCIFYETMKKLQIV